MHECRAGLHQGLDPLRRLLRHARAPRRLIRDVHGDLRAAAGRRPPAPFQTFRNSEILQKFRALGSRDQLAAANPHICGAAPRPLGRAQQGLSARLGQVEALPALLSENGELCIGPETYAMVADFADAAVSIDAVQAAIGVYQARRRRRAAAHIGARAPVR